MQIVDLEAFTFPVPFKIVFGHASATRSHAENFVVRVTTANSHQGYGEGCPRVYVTGEDLDSCVQFFAEYHEALRQNVTDVSTLLEWVQQHVDVIDCNPSAFCAIESAILDALGKERNLSVEALLNIDAISSPIRYSAVLGDSPYLIYRLLIQRYRRHGFSDFKIKLAGDLKKDQRKLRAWGRTATHEHKVRVDANNLWDGPTECIDYLGALPPVYWGVEEPLHSKDFDGMQEVADATSTKIILDESCTQAIDLLRIKGDLWCCNLRVAKLGGILRTLEVAKVATENNTRLIVGAHVGETSLLTRASLVVIQAWKNSQMATEGAFGTHLLREDLTEETIQFDRNACIRLDHTKFLGKPGWGLIVKPSKLIALST